MSVPAEQGTPAASSPTAAGQATFVVPAVHTHVLFDTPAVQAQSVFVVIFWSTLNIIEHEPSVAESQEAPPLPNASNGHSFAGPDMQTQ